MLRSEGEALRRELNEWRIRANLPRLEEPTRTPEFHNLINPQDIEGVNRMGVDGTGAGEWWDAEGLGEMGEEERKAYELSMQDGEDDGTGDDADEEMINASYKAPSPAAPVQDTAIINQMHLQQQLAPPNFPRGISFDNMPSHPALSAGVQTMYEPSGMPHGVSHALPVHPDFGAQAHHLNDAKLSASWPSSNLLLAQQQSQHAQQWPSFSPLNPSVSGNGASAMAANVFFLQQQQQQAAMQQVYGSPDMDDTSSVSSLDGRAGSVGGSPGPYEVNAGAASVGYGRRPSLSLSLNNTNWNGQQQPLATTGGGRLINAMMGVMM